MNLFKRGNDTVSKEEIAELLKISPEALDAFEKAYQGRTEENEANVPENLFAINAKMGAGMVQRKPFTAEENDLIDRIVAELVDGTEVMHVSGEGVTVTRFVSEKEIVPVTNEEVKMLPEVDRPQLTGSLMKRDMGNEPSFPLLLSTYKRFLEEKNPEKKMTAYHIFRQGLDILDLDGITYDIIGTNPNSMGNWIAQIAMANEKNGFFKIPETKVLKVPLSLLQLTRMDYFQNSPATIEVVNRYCRKVFDLDESKDYFIKTGTYSSKFDFRNAHVTAGQEVKELGSYLLYIHWQALQHAHYDLSGRNQPVIYGMSTTNEWVVREYVPDKEGNLEIYHGLPLRTEYRAFVDFDTKEVLGIHQYWDSSVMKKRFSQPPIDPSEQANLTHDYITYSANELALYQRYEANKDRVMEELQKLVSNASGMSGQWSIDVMQNGDEFYLIDAAVASQSAYYKEAVPENKRRPFVENWLPDFSERQKELEDKSEEMGER